MTDTLQRTRDEALADARTHVESARRNLESAVSCACEAEDPLWATRLSQALDQLGPFSATPEAAEQLAAQAPQAQRSHRRRLVIIASAIAVLPFAGWTLIKLRRQDTAPPEANASSRPTAGNLSAQVSACDVGNVDACYSLGQRYAVGDSVIEDVTKAAEYFQRGCDAYHRNIKADPELSSTGYHAGVRESVCSMAMMPRYSGMTSGQPNEVHDLAEQCLSRESAWSCLQAGLYARSIPIPTRWSDEASVRACAAKYLAAACEQGIQTACKLAERERRDSELAALPPCTNVESTWGAFVKADVARLRSETTDQVAVGSR